MWVFYIRVPVLRCFGSVIVAGQAAAGGVAGGACRLLHLSLAPGGFGGGQGENLDDDGCGRRSLFGGVLFLNLTISPSFGYCV